MQQSSGSIAEHQKIVHKVLLLKGPWRLWKQTTGGTKTTHGFIRYGLVGSGDISGILQDGSRIEIEVKSGSAKQSPQQKKFQAMIEKYNGIYFLVRSSEDAENQLQEICRLRSL